MLIGTIVIIDGYVACGKSGQSSVPFILNLVDNTIAKYENVMQYLDAEGLLSYINNIASKLRIIFHKIITVVTLDGKDHYIIVYHSEGRASNSSKNGKDGEGLSLSAINAVFADKIGSVTSAVPLNSIEITGKPIIASLMGRVLSAVADRATNGRFDTRIDKGFFFPVKEHSMDDLVKRGSMLTEHLDRVRTPANTKLVNDPLPTRSDSTNVTSSQPVGLLPGDIQQLSELKLSSNDKPKSRKTYTRKKL